MFLGNWGFRFDPLAIFAVVILFAINVGCDTWMYPCPLNLIVQSRNVLTCPIPFTLYFLQSILRTTAVCAAILEERRELYTVTVMYA